ncbi:MAG: ribokinase [Deltaproteobacteria bacterium]|jgi:ribokinase|nr:ribokinase [Deltaproteobacteria bacterium]
MNKPITIFGIFVADLNLRSKKIPVPGETLMGTFYPGPGGKGSNQAIATKRAGGDVSFIAKIGIDHYGNMAMERYKTEGIETNLIIEDENNPTGVAAILLEDDTGANAIVVCPGAASEFTVDEIINYEDQIRDSAYFMTQLETPMDTTFKAIEIANKHQTPVILNPAPAAELPRSVYPMCDYFTPNEVEASTLAGIPVETIADAEKAADVFLDWGVKNVIITFGDKGVFIKNKHLVEHIPASKLDNPVVDTTGAGDAFNGSFVAALYQGMDLITAVKFANASAGISVTRHGTALSTAYKHEIEESITK